MSVARAWGNNPVKAVNDLSLSACEKVSSWSEGSGSPDRSCCIVCSSFVRHCGKGGGCLAWLKKVGLRWLLARHRHHNRRCQADSQLIDPRNHPPPLQYIFQLNFHMRKIFTGRCYKEEMSAPENLRPTHNKKTIRAPWRPSARSSASTNPGKSLYVSVTYVQDWTHVLFN